MSIYGAMFSGVSGLTAQSQAIGMIGDNVTNSNTTGYKATNPSFYSLVTKQTTPSNYSPGGIRSAPQHEVEAQGLLQSSESPTDLAISGSGFFVVNEARNPGVGDEYVYTRAGNFTTDSDGYLRNAGGFYVQGWTLTADGEYDVDGDGAADGKTPDPNTLTELNPIRILNLTAAGKETSSVEIGANLPAADAIGDTHTTSMTIFDGLGVSHTIQFEWEKTAANEWKVTPGVDPNSATPGTMEMYDTDVGTGTTFNEMYLTFDGGTGALSTVTSATGGGGTNIDLDKLGLTITAWGQDAGGNDTTSADVIGGMDLNLGQTGSPNGMTQFSDEYKLFFVSQDGLKAGTFNGVLVDEDGTVTAQFDNGQTRPIYQIPVATFVNPNGLESATGDVFSETDLSGTFLLNVAGTGNAGSVAPGALEGSTVDIANEFTQMIITQRAYSASARIITTSDEMLNELIRLKT